jgi:hypothetical protein
MDLSEGFRLGNEALFNFFESKYSRGEWVAQKSRSSSSFLKSGSFLFIFFIEFSLLTVHVSCGDDSDKVASLREYNNKEAAGICLSKSGPPSFSNRVLLVLENKEWCIKKHLLTLPVLNIVFDEVFITITSVPLEAQETAENISHEILLYIPEIYMSRLFCGTKTETR